MELPLEIVAEVLRQLPEKQWPTARQDLKVPGFPQPILKKGETLHDTALAFLKKNRVATIDTLFTRPLLQALQKLDPTHFQMPHQVLSPGEFSQELRFIDFANRHSRYQRTLLSAMEVEGKDGGVLLHFNEPIDLPRWGTLKLKWPTSTPVAFRYSEHKILLFLNLRMKNGEETKRFLHNVRIVETLSQHMDAYREFINLSRLTFSRDVVVVDEPEKLLEVYRESDVRLILVGDGIDPDFREALVRIKKFDPYARFMLAKNTDPAEEAVFLLSVEGNYSRDNWR